MYRSIALAAVATVALGGSAFAQDSSMANMIVTDGVSITGDTATFASVNSAQDGYLVIHATQGGDAIVPASIGHTAIKAGENQNVAVTIEYPFADGESYVAMLHTETNGNGTYDFGQGSTDVDTPTMQDGAAVTSSFDAM